jgi:Icc-related predicted phosphoesterase
MPKIFFATDLHGSEVCWRKFLNAAKFYDCDVLICGGDMTGKAIIPIVEENGHFSYALAGDHQQVSASQVPEVEAQIRRKGYYPLRATPTQVRELEEDATKRATTFRQVMLEGVEQWMNLAADKLAGTGVRCFVCPGNDDEFEVDDVIRQAKAVELGEGRAVDIDGFTMISSGWSNPTPWNTHREESEEKLAERIDAMASKISDMSKAIFNLHCPPYKSGLDEAPAIDADLKLMHGGRALRPVGSKAVRDAIDRYQPLLSVHGHIHESKGAITLGKTLSINPGSAYEEGMLMAAIISLDAQKGIKSYQLVNG